MSCYRPKLINRNGVLETVSCGHCPACHYDKLAAWTFRLLQEDKVSSWSSFITLTYDSDHLVSTPHGRASLCKYDLQNFFKRLRKIKHGGARSDVKYYAVGEYGSQTRRPHYHGIIFNADPQLIEDAWTLGGKPIGSCYFGDVNDNSIGYTLKYLNKKSTVGLYGDDDRQPQFRLSSQGLGLSYLSDNIRSYHMADFWNRKFLELPGGQKLAMPRYYIEKLYDGYQRDLLKMSGSLIRQCEFYEQFTSQPYEKRIADARLFETRVEAAISRHEFHNNKPLLL